MNEYVGIKNSEAYYKMGGVTCKKELSLRMVYDTAPRTSRNIEREAS